MAEEWLKLRILNKWRKGLCKKLEEVKELEDFMWLTRKTGREITRGAEG